MSAWTEDEETALSSLVAAGKTVSQCAVALSRSPSAVSNKLYALRRAGVDVESKREKPDGSRGRPPNRLRSVRVSLRLHRSVRSALEAVLEDLTPQQRLELALERYIGAQPTIPEPSDIPCSLPRNERIGVQWSVDAELLARAVKRSKLSRPKTGELVIERLLKHYGYTFED